MASLKYFDFEIRGIKEKENMVTNALSRKVRVIHILVVSSYGTDLQEWILYAGHHDERYWQLKWRLQQQGEGDRDEECHLKADGLVKFKNMIYVLDSSDLKKLILMEFHVKSYSGHPGY